MAENHKLFVNSKRRALMQSKRAYCTMRDSRSQVAGSSLETSHFWQKHSVILNDLHARFENQSNFLNAFLKDLMIESDKWTNIDS